MSRKLLNAALLAACVVPAVAPAAQPGPSKSAVGNADQIQRGRYLVKITGCNDCHTPGYGLSGGKVPESLWLTGDKLGWRGPWGTTYAANLRLYVHGLSEAAWVKTAKNLKARPPMPWFALNDMSEQDLKAMYHYIKSLGPAGESAPAYVPEGKEPQQPYVQFPAPPK